MRGQSMVATFWMTGPTASRQSSRARSLVADAVRDRMGRLTAHFGCAAQVTNYGAPVAVLHSASCYFI